MKTRAKKEFDAIKTFEAIEKLLIEVAKNGYCMFVNDGTGQFFKGANPPRNQYGMVVGDAATYSCYPLINADGGASL